MKFFGKDIKPEQKAFMESLAPPMVVYDQGVNILDTDAELSGRKTIPRAQPAK